MRKFVLLLLIALGVWALVRFLPQERWDQTLAAVGVKTFFRETVPRYLREKLSIPESPAAKRKKLLEELAGHIGAIEQELGAAAPPALDGEPPALAPAPELRQRIEKSQELLNRSGEVVASLERVRTDQGLIAKAAERVLDRILPPPPPAAEGVSVCPTP